MLSFTEYYLLVNLDRIQCGNQDGAYLMGRLSTAIIKNNIVDLVVAADDEQLLSILKDVASKILTPALNEQEKPIKEMQTGIIEKIIATNNQEKLLQIMEKLK